MKKILAIILSMCLLCGTVALASEASGAGTATWNNTTVISYTIDAEDIIDEYTITIPPTLDLNENGTGYLDLAITPADGFNAKIKVSLYMDKVSGNLTNTTDSTATIPYTIDWGGNALDAERPVLIMDASDASMVASEQTVSLTVSATVSDASAAGTYSDTLTFRVTTE